MKEDNPSLKNIKGDNSREIIICLGWEIILIDLTHSSNIYLRQLLIFFKSSYMDYVV
mgnify:CR=1 FL=1